MALVSLPSVVTAFHKLLDKPLNHGEDLGIIETLNLLGRQHHWALHLLQSSYDLLGELDFLSHNQIVRKFNIDVEV